MMNEEELIVEEEDTDEFAEEAAELVAALPTSCAPLPPLADIAAEDFFSAGTDLDVLNFEDIDSRPGVLDRLGPAHFRSKEFRFMGFLQTVYNHVAEQVAGTTYKT